MSTKHIQKYTGLKPSYFKRHTSVLKTQKSVLSPIYIRKLCGSFCTEKKPGSRGTTLRKKAMQYRFYLRAL